MPLFVKKLDPAAKLPTVAFAGEDLCYDLYALEDAVIYPRLLPARLRTGISAIWKSVNIDDPVQYGLVIRDRSSVSTKQGVIKTGGEIDPGYRGELIVGLTALAGAYTVRAGDKIAQMRPVKLLTDNVVEVNELPPARRGISGFGSSGK